MRKTFVRMTLAALALVIGLVAFGLITVGQGIVAIALVQLTAFAVAKPCGALFNAVLTHEQVKEFQEILIQLRSGWEDVKCLPKAFEQLETKVNELRRTSLRGAVMGGTRVKGKISDECARELAAAVILNCARKGKLEALLPDNNQRERYFDEARSIIGRAQSTSEIPLPTAYSGQLIELIADFGVLRNEMSSYPLGGGISKPPRMGTRPAFGSIAMSAAFDEKKPTLEFCSMTPHKLGGIVITPRELEDQSIVPMGQFLARYGAVEFARAEDTWGFLADGSGTYEGVEGITKICADNDKVKQLAATKTKPSDAVLQDFRDMRALVSTAALSGGKYYLNMSWEAKLRSYNTVNERVFEYRPDGTATLDGFPIVWTEVLSAYGTAAAASQYLAVFGRLKFWFFGQRGTPRIDTSSDVYFENDQLATRFIEEIDFDYLSLQAASALQTADA